MALRTSTILSEEEWRAYFIHIGIPDSYANEYSIMFSEQQIPRPYLKLISDEELKACGIALIGHRLLIRHSGTATTAEVSRAQAPNSSVRHKSPQLAPSMTPSSFRAFVSHWRVFKQLVGIPTDDTHTSAQLFSLACTDHPEVRRTIADHMPNHLSMGEQEYLNMLQKLLTAQATPDTYRKKFFNMSQQQNETCQQWVRRLQEVSPDCDFTIRCSSDENVIHHFDDNLLRTKFILGLHHVNIRQDLCTYKVI